MRDRAHLEHRREPAKGRRFAWARLPDPNGFGVAWRLFRRSETTRRLVAHHVLVSVEDSRQQIAAELRRARWTLRNDVDAIDLLNLGLEP
ncbi:hypothetical protein [Lysobacter capsici]|uniref:hypothetical protein n=1 Tax=Lysobacter capsici TaxID=435897 RepID=UPI001C002386|nr:hypothetical protein [Lysobacter capsici]QWF19257.1 hypothetical protein KME82_11220 [Lysobacter capsici]